jgi:hypothetical protein
MSRLLRVHLVRLLLVGAVPVANDVAAVPSRDGGES